MQGSRERRGVQPFDPGAQLTDFQRARFSRSTGNRRVVSDGECKRPGCVASKKECDELRAKLSAETHRHALLGLARARAHTHARTQHTCPRNTPAHMPCAGCAKRLMLSTRTLMSAIEGGVGAAAAGDAGAAGWIDGHHHQSPRRRRRRKRSRPAADDALPEDYVGP